MKEQLITFETAKLAKEKGFPKLEINGYPQIASGYTKEGIETIVLDKSYYYQSPTQSLLQKWLREVHKIDVWCERFSTEESWIWQCPKANRTRILDSYYTYEEALEKGLQEALKLI